MLYGVHVDAWLRRCVIDQGYSTIALHFKPCLLGYDERKRIWEIRDTYAVLTPLMPNQRVLMPNLALPYFLPSHCATLRRLVEISAEIDGIQTNHYPEVRTKQVARSITPDVSSVELPHLEKRIDYREAHSIEQPASTSVKANA